MINSIETNPIRILRGPEARSREAVIITPDSIDQDNKSEPANNRRGIWRQARGSDTTSGRLMLIKRCADARLITPVPERAMEIDSIATAGSLDHYSALMQHPAFTNGAFIALGHYNGLSSSIDRMPEGCGGLGAKKSQQKLMEHEVKTEGIEGFIRRNIDHPDVVIATSITALKMATMTDRPTIAAVQDHRTGDINVLGVFSRDKSEYVTAVDPLLLFQGKYRPDEIYKDGMPSLDFSSLPPSVQEMMIDYDVQQKALRAIMPFPFLETYQEGQFPSMIAIETEVKPLEVRQPGLTELPNRVFRLNIPRQKLGNGIHVPQNALDMVLEQAEYPFRQAVKNAGNPNGDFYQTHTLFINTGSMDQSQEVARQILEQPYSFPWIQREGNQVIIAESVAGEIQKIDYYVPQAA